MPTQSLYDTFKRYRTRQTHVISALPIVILMPHSACNCRCVMCDIWKDNKNLKQLGYEDIRGLLGTFKKFGTRQVVMSGGEALLNPNFFRFCDLLKPHGIKVTLLSTGLLLKKYASSLAGSVGDIIVSLDGDEAVHDRIRNIPGAFQKLREGIQSLRSLRPDFPITGRTVIQQLNFRHWGAIVDSARMLGLDQISFLPADVSSQAFNREQVWDQPRQQEILVSEKELAEMRQVLNELFIRHKEQFDTRFIAESRDKIQKIYDYYAAFYGLNPFPYKKCNAPWVSTVVEADGTVRPCFFHSPLGNIHEQSLDLILNSEKAIGFRKSLDIDSDPTCLKCVCYLHLSPGRNPVSEPKS
jgi:Fe-coproporphyrin III synthase